MRRLIAIFAVLAISACAGDQTVREYGSSWKLVEMYGKKVAFDASLNLYEEGSIAGAGPCNQYNAPLTARYPKFKIGTISGTLVACPQLEQEQAFFAALSSARESQVQGETLILSGRDGQILIFRLDE